MPADYLQQLFVMGQEWRVQIKAAKNQGVAVRFEMHPAAKMAFKERAMLRRPGEIDTERRDLAVSAMTTHAQNPRQHHIYQQIGLGFGCLDIEELHGRLPRSALDANLFRAGKLFVARQPLQSILKRPAA